MTTARDVVKAALQNIEILGVNDDLEDDDGAVALAALARVSEDLGVEGVGIVTERQDNRTLTAAASFTIGSGGDSSATRPLTVVRAFYRVSNQDYPVTVRGRDWYMGLPDKSAQSTYPTDVHYDPTTPTGTMYVYPVPTGSPVLYWDSERQLTEATDLSDTLVVAPGFASLLEYRLTKRLAGKYGKKIKPEVVDWGEKIEAALLRRRAASTVKPIRLEQGMGGQYDVNTDQVG